MLVGVWLTRKGKICTEECCIDWGKNVTLDHNYPARWPMTQTAFRWHTNRHYSMIPDRATNSVPWALLDVWRNPWTPTSDSKQGHNRAWWVLKKQNEIPLSLIRHLTNQPWVVTNTLKASSRPRSKFHWTANVYIAIIMKTGTTPQSIPTTNDHDTHTYSH